MLLWHTLTSFSIRLQKLRVGALPGRAFYSSNWCLPDIADRAVITSVGGAISSRCQVTAELADCHVRRVVSCRDREQETGRVGRVVNDWKLSTRLEYAVVTIITSIVFGVASFFGVFVQWPPSALDVWIRLVLHRWMRDAIGSPTHFQQLFHTTI